MKQETRQKLIEFFTENINKELESFPYGRKDIIRLAFSCGPISSKGGNFKGLAVYFNEVTDFQKNLADIGFEDEQFTFDSYLEIGLVIREVASGIKSDFPKTIVNGKHNYEKFRSDLRIPYWQQMSYNYCMGVTFERKPCDEFNVLNDYLEKHYHTRLGVHDLYRIGLFGKRGDYHESGDKSYLCHSKWGCKYFLGELQRAGEGNIRFAFDDDIDTDYSRRYETECYGTRKRTLSVNGQELYW